MAIWLVPTVTASTMIAQLMGWAQGQMSQWACGNSLSGWEVPCAVNLHNAATVPQQRLGKVWPSLVPRE
jgi:hypothetical protein